MEKEGIIGFLFLVLSTSVDVEVLDGIVLSFAVLIHYKGYCIEVLYHSVVSHKGSILSLIIPNLHSIGMYRGVYRAVYGGYSGYRGYRCVLGHPPPVTCINALLSCDL